MDNRETFTGEEIMLIALRRLNYPCKLSALVRHEFGRTVTSLSLAFKRFSDHIYHYFLAKLTNNFGFFERYFKEYSLSIEEKLRKLNVNITGRYFICGFIDNSNQKCCRPGGDLVAPGGVGAERMEFDLQRNFYSKHKHLYGLKWQTVVFPDGMIGHALGGMGAKGNDLNDLVDSNINEMLAAIQLGNQFQ